MTRTTLMALTIGTILMAGSVEAKTPGPVCKAECAPRIEEDCGALRGKAFKRCRRSLVRACKATTPEKACFLSTDERPVDGRRPGIDDPGSGGGSRGDDDGGAGGGEGQDAVQAITELFDNKLITTETSDFFSSGSITTTREMRLCSSGAVFLVETQVTSTFGLGDIDNTFDSTTTFDGTWQIRVVGGAPVLEMDLGEAAPRRLTIQQTGQGDLVLDGVRASISDAAGACGGAPGDDGNAPGDGGAASDIAEQLAQAFAGHALILTTSNIGSGTTTTVIVLCDTGRYVKEVSISAAPGRVQDTVGPWSIEITNAGPVLILADDQGGAPSTFTIAEDADGNLLLNGIAVSEGDPNAVPGICAQV